MMGPKTVEGRAQPEPRRRAPRRANRALGAVIVVGLAGAVVLGAGCTSDESGGSDPGCVPGETECDGACVETSSDADNCGGCGVRCEQGLVCSAGSCDDSCATGLAECGRECANLASNSDHCGSCGNACGSDERCSQGNCVPRNPGAGGSGGASGGTSSGGASSGGTPSAGTSSGAASSGGAAAGGTSAGGTSSGGTSSGGTSSGGAAAGGTSAGGTSSGGSGGGGPPPSPTCDRPIDLVDTSNPDHVVGDGSPASCTEAEFRSAVQAGGTIVFDCGGPHTISIQNQIDLPINQDVTIDGGGEITLDGGRGSGNRSRIFEFRGIDYRKNRTTVTLQRLTLQNGAPEGTRYVDEIAGSPCAYGWGDGGGGAVLINDGILHVIDCTFRDNAAASPGPDIGGGGIYATGSLEVIVVGSVFENNEGSNGGGVGLLQSDGIFVNTRFSSNSATGTGANGAGQPQCEGVGHPGQTGAGGNGAAVVIDGGSVERVSFCGVTFEENTGGALGTVFRTPNSQREDMSFDRCLFDSNHTESGGGGIYTQDVNLSIVGSTFANNTSNGSGAGIRLESGVHGSTLELTNVTLYRNRSTRALGAGLNYTGPGSVTNCTFAENEAIGGYEPGPPERAFFGGAISGGGFEVNNTIFSDNRDTHPYTPMTCNVGSPLAGDNNVQWPRKRTGEDGNPSNIDDNPCTNGVIWQDPQLSALADNGGAVPTALPAPGSPAAGIGQGCPAYDATGTARPNSGCTAGAVELP